MNFLEFAQQNKITLEAKYIDMVPWPGSAPDEKHKYFQWHCTLTKGGDHIRVYSTEYYLGTGHAEYWYRGDKNSLTMARKFKSKVMPDPRYPANSGYSSDRLMVPHCPRIEDLLCSYQSDCQSGQILLFDEFCSDLGYDSDSRRAELIWRKCQTVCGELQNFFGVTFSEFMDCEES